MEWRPIKTLPPPRDRTERPESVLIYAPGRGVLEACAYPDGSFHDPVYWEWFSDGEKATHWMSLPEPPTAETLQGGSKTHSPT